MKRIASFWVGTMLLTAHLLAAPSPPAPLKISVPFSGSVALSVLDSRPDVVSGERKETFVGFTRSLYGIPYPAHTQSKKPFAQDLAALTRRALKSGGVTALVVAATPYEGREKAIQALQKSGAERLILIELRDWWSDTLIHTDLHYDLLLTVFNGSGQELGSSSVIGHDEIGRRQRPQRRDVATATDDILTTLFQADAVLGSFAADASPKEEVAKCTVEQVLKMKDAGLTQEQIEAACGAVE